VPACSSSPIPAVALAAAPAALAGDQCRSLLADLAQIPDPRQRRGRRHALGAVLAVAACAVLAGARSLARSVSGPRMRPARCWPRSEPAATR
jgi:DDE_Tnp_1-associated